MTNALSTRDIAALTAGIVAGIFGSRILPPLLASTNGSVRTRMGQDPFAPLINDHRIIQKTIRQMETTPSSRSAERAALFLTLKRTIGKHAMAEEDVVYPLLQTRTGAHAEARNLYSEHGDIKVHLFEIETLMKGKADWSAKVRELRELLDHHFRDEEDIEFPRLRTALAQKRKQQMAALIRREEALIL